MIRVDLCGTWDMSSPYGGGKAVVPGDYYTDLFRLGRIPDPYYRDNTRLIRDIPLKATYSRRFSFASREGYDRALLRFYGIDTLAQVYLNDIRLGAVDNMHRVWEFDVLEALREGENTLRVEFDSPTDYAAEQHRRRPLRGADDTIPGFQSLRKAYYMMGWDFAPVLPNLGLFRPVELALAAGGYLRSVSVKQETDAACARLTLKAHAALLREGSAQVVFRITDPDGTVRELPPRTMQGPGEREVCCEYSIPSPALWWPNGLGAHPLYTVEAILRFNGADTDTQVRRIGLRSLRLCTDADAYGREFCFRINGRKIFAMGANYAPEDSLPARRSPARTAALLDSCVAANFNMVRVWGGGFYPDDWFYDQCDERGLLVWQDCMFACCFLDDDPALLESIAVEVKENLDRFGHHACLALLCGNNEIEEAIADWGDWVADERVQATYLALFEGTIPDIIARSETPVDYIASSPTSGGGFREPNAPDVMDSHSWQVWHKNAPYESYREQYYRFCSEMGFESFPSLKILLPVTEEKNDLNIFSYEMEYRQRCANGNRLILLNMAQHYRIPDSFEKMIYVSQLMQADSMQYGVEHMRRHRGRCMGALYWQINDCWPGVSWSSVDYDGRWKALHYAAREFYAPQTLILSNCDGRVVFSVSNETLTRLSGRIRWRLASRDFTTLRTGEAAVRLEPLSAKDCLVEDFTELSYDAARDLFLTASLLDDTGAELASRVLLFVPSKHFRYPDPQIEATLHEADGSYFVTLTAKRFAHNVWMEFQNTDCRFSRNAFSITSGEPVTIRVEPRGDESPDRHSLHILSVNTIG